MVVFLTSAKTLSMISTQKLTNLFENFNKSSTTYEKVCLETQQCKSVNSHIPTKIIQLERNVPFNS